MPTPPLGIDLKKLLAGAQLPALPQSAIRLLELSQDPNNGPSEFAAPIEADPGLTSQVLRFVNSSYFGFSREISSVKLAITLVGIRTIKNFALWSAVFSLMPNPKCGPFDLKSLWQDSLRRALFARAMAHALGQKEAEEVFSAALLQDMAVPLLAKEIAGPYEKILQARTQGARRLSTVERQLFGWTHAEAGGLMARQWNLPDEFASLIEAHVDVDRMVADAALNPGRAAVAVSALLPTVADPAWLEFTRFETYWRQATSDRTGSLETILGKVDAEFAEFAPLLKISTQAKTLVAAGREMAAPVG